MLQRAPPLWGRQGADGPAVRVPAAVLQRKSPAQAERGAPERRSRPYQEAVGLPLGEEGEFSVSSQEFAALSEAEKVRFCSMSVVPYLRALCLSPRTPTV